MTRTSAEDFRDSFFQECEELLEAMHDGFEQMANGTHDAGTIHAIFRAVHSIKGGAGAFALEALVAFAHHFETALDMLRSGKVEAGYETLELFKSCGDHLSDLVAAARDGTDLPPGAGEPLFERLNAVVGHAPGEEEPAPDFEPMALSFDLDLPMAGAGPESVTYRIGFRAEPDLFASGNEPLLLFRALEKLGPLEARADLSDLPPLSALDPAQCYLRWQLTLETERDELAVREVFDFVEDLSELEIEPLRAPDPAADEAAEGIPSLAAMTDRAGPPPADTAGPGPASPASTADDPAAASGRGQAAAKDGKSATIRVDLDRVDKLINLVGELVVKEAMLSQSIADLALPSESNVSVGFESLRQLAGEIQEGVMAIRAQPVKPMFQRMARIVRETSATTGKRVRFVTHGDYTEVDKTVVERLVDPLTHMIRNAIDHGLEETEARLAAGKPAEGTVVLTAAHRSGRVMIDVSDDGGGINRDRVREIAAARGLIPAGADLTAAEIDNLLFMPGFSSKTEVSELSGRGVGLDVARSEIMALGGRVTIQSTPGQGTTFSISLPLTLAVMEGMVIDVAGQTMVVPITAIQESLQPKTAEIHRIGRAGRVLRNRDGMVPILDLGAIFGFRQPPEDLDRHVLLLIEADNGRRAALTVDNIQDQRQVVIKSIETNYRQIDGIAAATILGDGRIALIIDPDNIARDAPLPADPLRQAAR